MFKLVTLTAAAALVLAFGFGGVQTAYAEPSDLVSVWQFDEDVDEFGTARDAVDNNDGVVSGATSTGSGAFGRALVFDGVDDVVTIPDSGNLDITAALTLEAWIFRTKTNDFQGIVGKFDGAGDQRSYLLFVMNTNKLALCLSDNGVNNCPRIIVGGTNIPTNQWVHVAGTFNGTDLEVYVNGVSDGTDAGSAFTIHSGTSPVTIGDFTQTDPPHSFFGGRIDEVRIWNSALTDGEVAASHSLRGIADSNSVDIDSAKPGVEEVSTESVLVFFTASIYDVPKNIETDVTVCISPDTTLAEIDVKISSSNAFDERNKAWTPKKGPSDWDETASDTSAFASDLCAVAVDVDFRGPAKTLHLDLNLVDTDADAPLSGDIGSVGINIQRNPLGG